MRRESDNPRRERKAWPQPKFFRSQNLHGLPLMFNRSRKTGKVAAGCLAQLRPSSWQRLKWLEGPQQIQAEWSRPKSAKEPTKLPKAMRSLSMNTMMKKMKMEAKTKEALWRKIWILDTSIWLILSAMNLYISSLICYQLWIMIYKLLISTLYTQIYIFETIKILNLI